MPYLSFSLLSLPFLFPLFLLSLLLVEDVHFHHLTSLALCELLAGFLYVILILEHLVHLLHLIQLVSVTLFIEYQFMTLRTILHDSFLGKSHPLLTFGCILGFGDSREVFELMIRTFKGDEVIFIVNVSGMIDKFGVVLREDVLVLAFKHTVVLCSNLR